jgi:FkbM family methyltransferase
MQTGEFEQEEVSIIKDILKSASVFIDIGANIGFYTCVALHMGKRAIAIEPKRSNLDLLYRNMSINGWNDVEVYPVGLNEKPELRHLYGATGTAASLLKGWAGHSERFYEIIPTTTLDNLLSGGGYDQDVFIKIDVEGAEYFVLKGATKILSRRQKTKWLVEICFNEYHSSEMNPHYYDTFAMMWDHGYQAYTANAERRVITKDDVTKWIKNNTCDSGVINYLFM